jgi:hypothetical protein
MEINTSSESSTASVEAPSATPAPAADSTPAVADAIQPTGTDTGQPAQEPSQSGETVAGSQDDFPDDQAFSALPGEQRATNWQKARARIGELNQRVEQLSTLETFKPIADSIEQMGGWERAEPLLQLATNLFAPAVDEQGQPITDPRTGLPQYTAAPFVEQLAAQSLDTVSEILWRAFDVGVNDQETLGHWLLRERLGLDPALITTYQQIKSPEQAREYITSAGGIDPAIYEGVKPEYHEALTSLMNTRPGLRKEWEMMTDEARTELLEDRKEILEGKQFREEQQAHIAQQKQEREQAWKQQVQQAGERIIDEVRQRSISATAEKLKQKAVFFQDESDNQIVWNDIIQYGTSSVERDSQLSVDLGKIESLYHFQALCEARGDRLKANQAKVEADRLVTGINRAFGDFVTKRTAWWSSKLGASRTAQQQQITDARPRIEIDSAGDTSNGHQIPTYSPPPPGQRFGLTEERKQQLAAQLKARRMG